MMKKLCLQRLVTLAKRREQHARAEVNVLSSKYEEDLKAGLMPTDYIKACVELKDAMDLVALLTSEEYFNDVCSTFGVE